MIADETTRVRQSANATTPSDILLSLASDPSVTVRASLAMNPALPAEAATILSEDTDARVRSLLHRNRETPSAQVRENAVANLTAMLTDAALRMRVNIAATVREMSDGPREIVLRLAHDPAPIVCEPVIRSSPMLTQQDLVALVESDVPPSTIMAVARRPRIGEAVSDAIAGFAGPAAIAALLANPTATIRETTLDALAAQAEDQPSWQKSLATRPGLSARARRILAEIESDDQQISQTARASTVLVTPTVSRGSGPQRNTTETTAEPRRAWLPRRIQGSVAK